MRLLIPAAGVSRRFRDKGILTPKPLIKFQYGLSPARTMLEHAISGIGNKPLVGVLEKDKRDWTWPARVDLIPLAVEETQGQADTVLKMLKWMDAAGIFVDDEDVLILNSDARITYDLDTFVRQSNDFHCAALVFEDRNKWPTVPPYSYVNAFPEFQRAAEKEQISPWAIAGAFYFSKMALLRDAILEQIANKERAKNDEYYLSGTLARHTGDKLAVLCKREQVISWGTPEELFGDPQVTHVQALTE